MSEKLKVALNISKVGDNNQILIKNIEDEIIEFTRNYGIDGQDFRIKNSDPDKIIDLSSYSGIEFLRLSAVWDETDENLAIVKGKPAPFEFQIGGGSNPFYKQTRITFENPIGINSLKIRNPDSVNNKYIKVKVILSSTGISI